MLRRFASKPRGLLRDATIVIGLIVLDPTVGFLTAGAGILLVGAGLHFWSKGTLVRNWTVTRGGPYRLVRHPFYLSCFFIDDGICCMSGEVWLVVVYLAAFMLVYLPTIRKEERALTDTQGTAYTSYTKEVPMLVPYRLHALVGPLDFAWANLIREKEFSRTLRILAIPSYFVMIAVVFHDDFITGRTDRILALIVSAVWAFSLNVGAAVVRRRERAAIGFG